MLIKCLSKLPYWCSCSPLFSHTEVTFCLCDIYYRQCIGKLSYFVPIKQNGNKVPSDSWLSRPALQLEKLSEG